MVNLPRSAALNASSLTGKVLVVGAGLAGLVATYRLRQAGIAVDLIESRDRPGGRVFSVSNALGTGIAAEIGGEAFDSDHAASLTLAEALGLPLADVSTVTPDQPNTVFWAGQYADYAVLQAELAGLLRVRSADYQAVQQFMVTAQATREITALDGLSISTYLDQIGASKSLQGFVSLAYIIKYGVDAKEQSCLNLLCFFRQAQDCEALFGYGDERFYIRGGNDQLPQALTAAVADCLRLNTSLVALAETSEGTYRATFGQGEAVTEQHYDRVVLTLPFTVLRHIPLQVKLSARKRRVINQLSSNDAIKLITAYRGKPWRSHPSNGLAYTDLPLQHCWEASDSLLANENGLLVASAGGAAGRSLAQMDLAAATQQTRDQLEQIWPGVAKASLSREGLRSGWGADPHSLGGYTCYRVREWSTFFGSEAPREGNLFFAGEHCSRVYQGYMEGACETAEHVAWEIFRDLNLPAAAEQQERLQYQAALRKTGFVLKG
ncbi:MAG: flavin monoamine oxidase family protein [Leptolyngbyaceae cyanobacterium]